jgi:hypothetical protein
VFSWSDGTQVHTWESGEFSDVDSGDTVSLGSHCLLPPAMCAGGVAGIPQGLSIQVYEIDGEYNYGEIGNSTKTGITLLGGGAGAGLAALFGLDPATGYGAGVAIANYLGELLGDDLIGSLTLAYGEYDFTSVLPTVGSTYEESVRITGPGGDLPEWLEHDADYSVRIRATRLADKVVALPPVLSAA